MTVTNATAGRLARGELAVRRRQMECIGDPKRRLVAARNLVAAKEAGAAYWRGWKGAELVFKDGTKTEFDARARSWRTGRLGETGTQFSNRFALSPINAMRVALGEAGDVGARMGCVRAVANKDRDGCFWVHPITKV